MKKFLILFIAVFALCSCSKDDDNFDKINYDIFGVYQVAGVLSNSNINQNESFVLFPNSSEYNKIWRIGDNKHHSEIGEFYGGNERYKIDKYELHNDELTLYIYNDRDAIGYVYKFVFKISNYNYHNYFYLTCIDSEKTEFLKLNRNDKIKLVYLGYHCEDWAPKVFNF